MVGGSYFYVWCCGVIELFLVIFVVSVWGVNVLEIGVRVWNMMKCVMELNVEIFCWYL